MREKNNPRNALIAVALVFLLLFLAGLGSRGITLYELADALMFAPVKKGLSLLHSTGKAVLDAGAFFESKKKLLEENRNLLLENRTLQNKISLLETEQMQNERLREILNLRLSANFNFSVANVLGYSSNPFNSIIIDKGMDCGIKQGDPVITVKNGISELVGVVYSAGKNSSKVLLETDPRFFVAVKDGFTGEMGIAQGNDSSLVLNFKMRFPKIQNGDPLFTTSESSVYPEGIFAGRVESVKKINIATTIVTVSPATDFSHLFEVLVIKK